MHVPIYNEVTNQVQVPRPRIVFPGNGHTMTGGVAMSTTQASQGTARWKIDASHTLVEFAVRHLMISTVKGRFAQVEGTITADPDRLTEAQVQVSIDTASIDTRDEQRDAHLRSADFFDVEKFPKMTFTSREIKSKGDNR